jgi:SAM-dependent methyltransferase
MCFDAAEHEPFYRWQMEHGAWDKYAGGTDCGVVCDLAAGARVTGASVLDIGCGDGNVAEALSRRFGPWAQYTGVEPVPSVRDAFAARGLGGTTLVPAAASAATLAELPVDSFDLVLCLFLLQDVCGDEGGALIAAVPRLLKPGGHAVWGLTVREGPSKRGRRVPPELAAQGCPDHPVYTWGMEDLKESLRRSGLEVVRASGEKDQNGNIAWYGLTLRTTKGTQLDHTES